MLDTLVLPALTVNAMIRHAIYTGTNHSYSLHMLHQETDSREDVSPSITIYISLRAGLTNIFRTYSRKILFFQTPHRSSYKQPPQSITFYVGFFIGVVLRE